ncbi:MAG: hypothetical protein AB7G47_11595 [Mycolicibacterium sp.]|uniref:hypothetical protein n=1 Tax=Mycolicibacterium sp. TaxID=2320850 RepID=UPI003D0FA1DB
MGNPPPLRVDAPSLNWDPADVTVPPVPTIPPGEDPMSQMISAIMPGLATPLADAVAATRAREEEFASNLAGARSAYQATDQAAEQEITTAADSQSARTQPAVAGSASDQTGQFIATAMQTVGQVPTQIAGMATAAMLGIAQGSQGAMQQVSQLAGQLGKPEREDRPDSQDQGPLGAGEGAAAGKSPSGVAPVQKTQPTEAPARQPLSDQA